MREDIFEKLQVLQEKNIDMDSEFKRYLEFHIKQGKRNGLHLSKDVQQEIKNTKNKINELCSEFLRNLNEVSTVIEFSDEELAGMPSDFIEQLEKLADSGKRQVTLKYPHYFPIMRKAQNPATRKQMLFAFNTQCIEENTRIMEELVMLRHKCAELLGFPNHVAYATDICHAKNAENVSNFLNELAEKVNSLWLVEKTALLELKEQECKELNMPFDGRLNDFDLMYYTTKIKELHYSIEEDKVQEYFPLPVVTKGLLSVYQNLLSLTFKAVENAKTWHPDVQMFSVEDASSGELLGYFFLDLFPREGKYGHASLFPLQIPCISPDGTRIIAVGAMVANMTKPTAEKPSLLTHRELITFFHEFGHVMHQMCMKTPVFHFNNLLEICRDFIETPSKMLEEWCWEPTIIRLLSSHITKACPMPDDMLNSLSKSRLANTAVLMLQRVALAMLDQKMHTQKKVDTKALYRDIQVEMLGISPLEGTNFVAHFSHLANRYDAQYYGYLWSEVFSKDMYWTRFKDGNMLNPNIGKEYRSKVLEVGGAKDVKDILRDFIGREPSQNAFFLSRGLNVV